VLSPRRFRGDSRLSPGDSRRSPDDSSRRLKGRLLWPTHTTTTLGHIPVAPAYLRPPPSITAASQPTNSSPPANYLHYRLAQPPHSATSPSRPPISDLRPPLPPPHNQLTPLPLPSTPPLEISGATPNPLQRPQQSLWSTIAFTCHHPQKPPHRWLVVA
jgi:hypothetical protein